MAISSGTYNHVPMGDVYGYLFLLLVLLGPINPKYLEDYVLALSHSIVVIKLCLKKS